MLIRLIGSFLIIGTTALIGVMLGQREKYRIADLEEIERAMILMKNRISYLGTPMDELLEEISWKTKGVIGDIFQKISETMKNRDGDSAEEIWQSCWAEGIKNTYLTNHDMEELISFGRTLGFLEKQQQSGSIDIFLFYIREQQERIKKRLDKNGRLYYTMGALTGLLAVVILL